MASHIMPPARLLMPCGAGRVIFVRCEEITSTARKQPFAFGVASRAETTPVLVLPRWLPRIRRQVRLVPLTGCPLDCSVAVGRNAEPVMMSLPLPRVSVSSQATAGKRQEKAPLN